MKQLRSLIGLYRISVLDEYRPRLRQKITVKEMFTTFEGNDMWKDQRQYRV